MAWLSVQVSMSGSVPRTFYVRNRLHIRTQNPVNCGLPKPPRNLCTSQRPHDNRLVFEILSSLSAFQDFPARSGLFAASSSHGMVQYCNHEHLCKRPDEVLLRVPGFGPYCPVLVLRYEEQPCFPNPLSLSTMGAFLSAWQSSFGTRRHNHESFPVDEWGPHE